MKHRLVFVYNDGSTEEFECLGEGKVNPVFVMADLPDGSTVCRVIAHLRGWHYTPPKLVAAQSVVLPGGRLAQ